MLFEFLQIAIGNRDSLPTAISDSDWQRLFEFSKKHALIGIGFSAVEKLHCGGVKCPAGLRMKWMAMALQIEQRNELMNGQCKELTCRLRHDGLECCILKGQGNLLNYPDVLRLRRTPGDIDVWAAIIKNEKLIIKKLQKEEPISQQEDEGIAIAVQTGENEAAYVTFHGKKALVEYAKMQYRLKGFDETPKKGYHHIELPKMNGTEIELHFIPSYSCVPFRNRRMRRLFEVHKSEFVNNMSKMGFPVPTPSMNVVYQLCHIFNHHFYEGIGLRQLMDYYFALVRWHNDMEEARDFESRGLSTEGIGHHVMSNTEIISVLKSFGLVKFAAAVMYVLHEVFAMPTHYYICEPNEKEGKKLLAEIMNSGNFGHYDVEKPNVYQHRLQYHIWKFKRIFRLAMSYPEEAMWEPVFRGWRRILRMAGK